MWFNLLDCRVYYMSGPSHRNTSVPQNLSIPIFQTPDINFVVFLTNYNYNEPFHIVVI